MSVLRFGLYLNIYLSILPYRRLAFSSRTACIVPRDLERQMSPVGVTKSASALSKISMSLLTADPRAAGGMGG